MALWAIVPVKPLRSGKSRLAGVLSSEERTALNECLFTNTLQVLKSIPELDHVLVISRDQEALAIARNFGARTVQENGDSKLNLALAKATIVAQEYSTRSILIVPADLPLISPQDIHHLIERAKAPPVVVVSPDRKYQGTNALLICPIGLIDYEFGPGSFERHCQLAIQAGARLEICELPSLRVDMDLPEDLDFIIQELESLSL
jgi:2-phospho-L-lactate guanylyltransferase